MLTEIPTAAPEGKLTFKDADLEIRARLVQSAVCIDVMKSGSRVHSLTINDAVGHMEYSWLAAMFAREDRVEPAPIVHEAADYVSNLNINQG